VDSGFYAAAAGLRAQSQALEVAAHNLANVNTPGFRGELTTFQSLLTFSHPTIQNALNLATNNFGVLQGTRLDLEEGNLTATGNPLDVGIEGQGFFALQTARGTRYTRNGSFQISTSGLLVTSAGDPVLGDTGPIHIPAGPVAISADGTLSVSGTVAGHIRVVDFPPNTSLMPEGGTLLSAPAGTEQPAQGAVLRQSTLESSNVNAISSVVGLIGVQREAEMVGRAMSLFDTEFNHIAAADLAKV
jgi:flagellar basal-body rod protein FlgF